VLLLGPGGETQGKESLGQGDGEGRGGRGGGGQRETERGRRGREAAAVSVDWMLVAGVSLGHGAGQEIPAVLV